MTTSITNNAINCMCTDTSTIRKLAAGGEPSTWFPPGGLVETAGTTWHALRPRLKPQQQLKFADFHNGKPILVI